MKRNTALILAFAIVFGIVGGGAVFLFNNAQAAEYTDIQRTELNIVSSSTISTNGTVIGSYNNGIIYGGANENGVFPFVAANRVRLASLNPGKIYYMEAGNVSTRELTSVYKYCNQNINIYYTSAPAVDGAVYSIPSSGNAVNNAIYDAAALLIFSGSYKNASKLYYDSQFYLHNIYVTDTEVLDITDSIGSNSTYGYVVRVGTRIYVICPNGNARPTRFKFTSSNYIDINQTVTVNNYSFIYGYYDMNSTNLAVINFTDFEDALNQVYFWENGVDSNPEPDPEPPAIHSGVTFILKPGYACDIYYGGESYDVTAYRYGIRSAAFQTNGFWWPFDNVLYATGVSSPIAQNIDIYNSETYSQIPWDKAPPFSWFFGVTENAVFSGSGYDGHTIICNPIHYYGATANTGFSTPIQEQQTPIKITVSDEESQLTIYCWSLADSVENGVIHSTTVSRYKLGGDGMWYDANDEMIILEIGGETDVESNQQATLDDLVSNLDSFFTGTWRHIRQLVTSAGKLPSVVIEMYSWLPDEYKAVLFSAFGITVVVAILKVML